MAQWTTIDPNTLLPGDPWTSAKAQAAFENVEAVAEGAPGAPRNLQRSIPLGYLPNIGIVGTTPVGYNDLDPLTSVDLNIVATLPSGASQNLQIRSSANNGDTWGSWITINTFTAGAVRSYHGGFNLVTGIFNACGLFTLSATEIFSVNINTGVTGVNAFQFRFSGSGGSSGFVNGRVMSRGNTE